jgi:hypothetical protein
MEEIDETTGAPGIEVVNREPQTPQSGVLTLGEVQDMLATATVKAARDAVAAERNRILAVHAACQANNAAPMFARMVEDGSTEQQANGRILDAITMRNEDNDICSRHGGGPAKAGFNTRDIYDRRGR